MTTTSTKASEVLAKAADLIEPLGAWTQGSFARTAGAGVIRPSDPGATCWCAAGAIVRIAGGTSKARRAFDYMGGRIGNVAQFNDAPERTQTEVVAALRDASNLAAQEGK